MSLTGCMLRGLAGAGVAAVAVGAACDLGLVVAELDGLAALSSELLPSSAVAFGSAAGLPAALPPEAMLKATFCATELEGEADFEALLLSGLFEELSVEVLPPDLSEELLEGGANCLATVVA